MTKIETFRDRVCVDLMEFANVTRAYTKSIEAASKQVHEGKYGRAVTLLKKVLLDCHKFTDSNDVVRGGLDYVGTKNVMNGLLNILGDIDEAVFDGKNPVIADMF